MTKNRITSITLILLSVLFLSGCSSEPDYKANVDISNGFYNEEDKKQKKNLTDSLVDQFTDPDAWKINKPVAGHLMTKPFRIDKAFYDRGYLVLQQGKSFYAELGLILALGRSISSLDKSIHRVNRNDTGYDRPTVVVSSQKGPQGRPSRVVVSSGYKLALQFGVQDIEGIPFHIDIEIPGKKTATWIRGEGVAKFEGTASLLDEEREDYSKDIPDTFKRLGERWSQHYHFGYLVNVKEYLATDFHLGKNRYLGLLVQRVHLDDQDETFDKLLMRKTIDGWEVLRPIGLQDLAQAQAPEPNHEIDEDDYQKALVEYRAAREIQHRIRESETPEKIVRSKITCSDPDEQHHSKCQVDLWKLNGENEVIKTRSEIMMSRQEFGWDFLTQKPDAET